jgi:cell division protein FtsL
MRNNIQHSFHNRQELRVNVASTPRGSAFGVVFLVGIGIVSMVAFVWLTNRTDQLKNQLTVLERKQGICQSKVENLKLKYSQVTDRTHLAEAVRKFNLGLRPPANGQVRRIKLDAELPDNDYFFTDTSLKSAQNQL